MTRVPLPDETQFFKENVTPLLVQRTFDTLDEAYRQANCIKYDEMAPAILKFMQNRSNMSVEEAVAKAVAGTLPGFESLAGMSSAVNSYRVKKLSRGPFQASLESSWLRDFLEDYEKFPSDDGTVDIGGDGHEATHHLQSQDARNRGRKGSKRRAEWEASGRMKIVEVKPYERAAWAVAAVAGNRVSEKAEMLLTVNATWKHKGVRLVRPLAFRLLSPEENNPTNQAEHLIEVVKRVPVKVRATILDRGYDAAIVRKKFRQAGLKCVVRLRLNPKQKRYFYIPETGETFELNERMKDLAGDLRRQMVTEHWEENGKIVTAIGRRQILEVVGQDEDDLDKPIDPNGPRVKLQLRAAIRLEEVEQDKNITRKKAKKWVFDSYRSLAVFMDVDANMAECHDLYRVRWVATETQLEHLSINKARNAPKLINKFYTEYAAMFVVAMNAAASMSLVLVAKLRAAMHGLPAYRFTSPVMRRLIGAFSGLQAAASK